MQSYLDPLIQEFTTGPYYKEVFDAKEEYFEKAGIVYEDDIEYEQRMSIFMDWYLFDRDLPKVDLPPIKIFFQKNKKNWSDEERKIYKDFCETQYSIFKLNRLSWNKKTFIVEDLFSKKKYRVNDTHFYKGFSRGDIFEARIIPFKGNYEFSKGFCFHPAEMSSFIINEIKKVRHQDRTKHQKLILQLSSMKLKHMRFNHIDVKHIYSFDSKF
ncbi:MAG: hypothetical protein CL678_10955 [Bdellovibrionaceae bacterium]|nr:hypothetical protein [Pseudobdellovibrionaceae bacterium]